MVESVMQTTSDGPISVGGQFLETSEQHFILKKNSHIT